MISEEYFQFVEIDHAASLQRDLSIRVKSIDDPDFEPRFLCGMDVAYDGETAFVAAAVWDAAVREIVETATVVNSVPTRYVPGFLGFREGPLLVRVAEELRVRPDVFLIDGQGIAHPRKFGLACHVGLALDKPTIGVAKSRLYGRTDQGRILDPWGEIIGRILMVGNRKFYVSVGHRISLETASDIVEKSIVNGHPSPLRQAHLESIRAKQRGRN
ncbi:MAG TPA: endonuclease V [Candidatus Angelobacter sp.]|nr:endonuclease V [Candidatus Angelobacter sp.]